MTKKAKTTWENVFICSKCDGDAVIVTVAKEVKCPVCEKDMECAGWFESGIGAKEK